MAQLKDLVVNGATRLIGDAYANSIQITTIKIPTASGGTSYSAGTSGYVIKSNGTSVYWAPDNNTTYSAFTGKPTGNQTPGFGSTFTIQQISQNAAGQVSGTDRTVTIPNTAATTQAAGLMSAADKTKLDGIAASANNYSHPTYTSKNLGFYKVQVDGTGHVSNTAAVTKADLTGLGVTEVTLVTWNSVS